MKKLICLLLAALFLLSGCAQEEEGDVSGEATAEVTATPTPTVAPTETPVPTPEPTNVPVVAFGNYQYYIVQNTALAVEFKYPSHWINEPGKQSIRYTEPVNAGDTPAQLTVTSKAVSKRPDDDAMEAQMKAFLAYVEEQVEEYVADKNDFRDDVEILNTEGVRQKYTAVDPDTGEEITGYALMAYVKSAKRIYLLHFTAASGDYEELSGVIDVIRDSMQVK